MNALELKIPPPAWFLLALGFAFGLDWVAPWARTPINGLPQIGVVIAIISVLFAMAAIRGFRRVKTTISPHAPAKTSQLVQDGPFRLSRNPMYVGLAGVLVAAAFSLQNPLALLAVPAFVAVVTRLQIIPEERVLAETFGADFEAFRARVPRWLFI